MHKLSTMLLSLFMKSFNQTSVDFHQILGRVTKIRTALWELQQSQPEKNEALQVAIDESEALVTDIDTLRDHVNQMPSQK